MSFSRSFLAARTPLPVEATSRTWRVIFCSTMSCIFVLLWGIGRRFSCHSDGDGPRALQRGYEGLQTGAITLFCAVCLLPIQHPWDYKECAKCGALVHHGCRLICNGCFGRFCNHCNQRHIVLGRKISACEMSPKIIYNLLMRIG